MLAPILVKGTKRRVTGCQESVDSGRKPERGEDGGHEISRNEEPGRRLAVRGGRYASRPGGDALKSQRHEEEERIGSANGREFSLRKGRLILPAQEEEPGRARGPRSRLVHDWSSWFRKEPGRL